MIRSCMWPWIMQAVLNVSDTANISLQGWWNPYNAPNNNWFSSPVHTNEMEFLAREKLVFLSTGKSDMVVVDVSNSFPADSCNFYGGLSNSIGTRGNRIVEGSNLPFLSARWFLSLPTGQGNHPQVLTHHADWNGG
ncbi:MAG: hypothetical protein R3B47_10315 [Bacteroidia bacterium]